MAMADMTSHTGSKQAMERLFQRKRLVTFGAFAAIALYFVYIFFAFDVAGLMQRASADNARALMADTVSYKVHVTRDNRSGAVSSAIEGHRKGRYPEGTSPDWVETAGDITTIDLGDGHVVTYGPETITYDIPGYGLVSATPTRQGIVQDFPAGDLPDWINASKNRVAISTDAGRLTVTRNRTEVFRYFPGWEIFWFTLDSPYHGMGPVELGGHALSGEAAEIFDDFWNNPAWLHSQVFWALFETILMAFLGTCGAALVALPLAFLAARNFTPLLMIRFAARRLFDFVRGVDALIWTIILTRAFGLGPLTGALAILITDTGSFGKLFSEALENVDKKQIEGIASTGAKPLQRYRFGVLPQVVPVLLSQVLYFLESNTRSATIIGAITGGGIGLLLTQAIITQADWEKVTYYIVLIVIMVIVMDWLSGWLRRRLITGDDGGH
ncbi:MAG: phosphonate ABC transporter, permease protein PhnE [Marinibacterium sp.]|nr:phosphonate ABC transporter, permease protein PhnE [Marinibacterium sp.]